MSYTGYGNPVIAALLSASVIACFLFLSISAHHRHGDCHRGPEHCEQCRLQKEFDNKSALDTVKRFSPAIHQSGIYFEPDLLCIGLILVCPEQYFVRIVNPLHPRGPPA